MNHITLELKIYPGNKLYGDKQVEITARDQDPNKVADLLISLALTLWSKELPRNKKGQFTKSSSHGNSWEKSI